MLRNSSGAGASGARMGIRFALLMALLPLAAVARNADMSLIDCIQDAREAGGDPSACVGAARAGEDEALTSNECMMHRSRTGQVHPDCLPDDQPRGAAAPAIPSCGPLGNGDPSVAPHVVEADIKERFCDAFARRLTRPHDAGPPDRDVVVQALIAEMHRQIPEEVRYLDGVAAVFEHIPTGTRVVAPIAPLSVPLFWQTRADIAAPPRCAGDGARVACEVEVVLSQEGGGARLSPALLGPLGAYGIGSEGILGGDSESRRAVRIVFVREGRRWEPEGLGPLLREMLAEF